MAIYSFNHDTFGRTTNRAGAAGDNAAYNSREDATRLDDQGRPELSAADNAAYNAREEVVYAIRSHVIPPDAKAAEAWFRGQEKTERKNARMSDRFIAALPRELTPEQCIEAVEGFCREVTDNRIPWHFALHLELEKKDQPDWNPHVHMIFRDRDIETGRRVLYTSAGPKERRQLDAKGIDYWTTKDFRVAWNDHLNNALERAGCDERVDHRSLQEQGIDRTPGIHIGPGAQNAAGKGHAFESMDIQRGRRTIAYSVFDDGTRAEHAARIKAANDSPQLQPTTPRALAAQREQNRLRQGQQTARLDQRKEQELDRAALRGAHQAEIKLHRTWAKTFAADERRGGAHSPADVRAITGAAWGEMQVLHAEDRKGLADAHRLETAALSRAHAAERMAVSARCAAEGLQAMTNQIAGRTRAGMAAQQTMAVQQMQAHATAKRSPFERARALTETANREHDLTGEIRTKLASQRQTNRLIATDPEAQARRALATLTRVVATAEPVSGRTDKSGDMRTTPFSVLDTAVRNRHAAAEQSWQTQTAQTRSGPEQGWGPLARAQSAEGKALRAEQVLDHAALHRLHKVEQVQLAARTKALTVVVRRTAKSQVREAMQPKWQAVRAIPDKTQRASAAKAVNVERQSLTTAAVDRAVGKVHAVAATARTSMLSVQAQDRKYLSDAHALESAALTRVHGTERLATRAHAPAIAATAISQRAMVRDLRTTLNAHRQTCRLMAGAGSVSSGQADRAVAALRRVIADDHQRQQQSNLVARGGGTDADRTSASPQARERADRDRRADKQRSAESNPSSSSTGGKGRKAGGRGR